MKYPVFIVVNQAAHPLCICESEDEAIKMLGTIALRAAKNGSVETFRLVLVDPPEEM